MEEVTVDKSNYTKIDFELEDGGVQVQNRRRR